MIICDRCGRESQGGLETLNEGAAKGIHACESCVSLINKKLIHIHDAASYLEEKHRAEAIARWAGRENTWRRTGRITRDRFRKRIFGIRQSYRKLGMLRR